MRVKTLMHAVMVLLTGAHGSNTKDKCVGEFQRCPKSGECTLFDCGGKGPKCAENEYRCPISNKCIKVVSVEWFVRLRIKRN